VNGRRTRTAERQFPFTIHRSLLTLCAFLLACGRDHRTPVLVYSPHGRDQLLLLEHAFEQERPDIDIRWLDLGSQEILDRLRFERVNPQADVWFGGPTTVFDRGVRDSLLQPYRPEWVAQTDSSAWGPDDLYFGVYRTPAVIAYNSNAVRADEAPTDWDDVLDPRWHDEVLIRDPGLVRPYRVAVVRDHRRGSVHAEVEITGSPCTRVGVFHPLGPIGLEEGVAHPTIENRGGATKPDVRLRIDPLEPEPVEDLLAAKVEPADVDVGTLRLEGALEQQQLVATVRGVHEDGRPMIASAREDEQAQAKRQAAHGTPARLLNASKFANSRYAPGTPAGSCRNHAYDV